MELAAFRKCYREVVRTRVEQRRRAGEPVPDTLLEEPTAFFFQAEAGIRDLIVTGVQTCALPICLRGRVGWGLETAAMAARPKKTRARKESLAEYGRKRDFDRTSEPKPAPPPYSPLRRAGKAKRAQPPPSPPPLAGEGREGVGHGADAPLPTLHREGEEGAASAFVVQKHAARRLHYDLRLELDGVLKSWAVTRGPSLTLGEKRLAVRTEDHPIEYVNFEGNIPKGEYGGGSMIVWDQGRWVPEGDPHNALTKGHLAFRLDGARLKGNWHLVRMRPRRGEKTEPWLLIKSEDEFARHPGDPEITDEEATSRISGRTNEELAAAGDLRVDHAARAAAARGRKRILPDVGKVAGARKGLLPTFLEPSLASPCDKPPSGPK